MNNDIRKQQLLTEIGKRIREKKRDGRRIKARTENNNTMTTSVAEEANAFSIGNNRACSNGGSRENKYSGS